MPFVYLLIGFIALTFALIGLGLIAPVALFALKAKLIPVPRDIRDGAWDARDAWGWAFTVSAVITILGAFGALMLYRDVIHPSVDIARAHVAAYGFGTRCTIPPSDAGFFDLCPFGWIFNVVVIDGLPFFFATAFSLYSRAASANGRAKRRSVWPFLTPALIGAGVFLVSTHMWDWWDAASTEGGAAFANAVADAVWHEVSAPFTFLAALFGTPMPIDQWLHDELLRIHGSFYKLTSLYPKVLIVLLVGGLVEYVLSPSKLAP